MRRAQAVTRGADLGNSGVMKNALDQGERSQPGQSPNVLFATALQNVMARTFSMGHKSTATVMIMGI
jgi:hypothetical protein